MKKILRILNPFGRRRHVAKRSKPDYLQIRVDHLERENSSLNRRLYQFMKLAGYTDYGDTVMEAKEVNRLKKKYGDGYEIF